MAGPGSEAAKVHPSASVEDGVELGAGTRVWSNVQIRTGARVGTNCVVGRNVFIDADVHVGDNVKIQNNASLYIGVEVHDGAFIGPHVIFTNDLVPRAVNPDGTLKSADDWEIGRTVVEAGAALGAGCVVVTGRTIGRWSIVGSGAVVTKDVPPFALVVGNPGRIIGWVSASGERCASAEEAERRSEQERAALGSERDGA